MSLSVELDPRVRDPRGCRAPDPLKRAIADAMKAGVRKLAEGERVNVIEDDDLVIQISVRSGAQKRYFNAKLTETKGVGSPHD